MTKLHPTVANLLAEIEAYCARANIDRTRFGILVANDSHFISRLRHGRQPRLATIDRVQAYINRRTKAVLPVLRSGETRRK